jgi:beta-aspartyl-dipeptidase (metallo-type)
MIGGKAGLVHLHLGSGPRLLEPVLRIVKQTEIPIGQFLPTHVTRTAPLLEQAVQFARLGGNIDFTVKGKDLSFPLTTQQALERALEAGVPVDRITLSSDANGSMPVFDQKGNLIRLAVGSVQNLFREWRDLVQDGFPLAEMLKLVTANPAKRIGAFPRKGSLAEGKDADILILNPGLTIESVMAKGRFCLEQGRNQVRGTFEDEGERVTMLK